MRIRIVKEENSPTDKVAQKTADTLINTGSGQSVNNQVNNLKSYAKAIEVYMRGLLNKEPDSFITQVQKDSRLTQIVKLLNSIQGEQSTSLDRSLPSKK